MSSEREGRHRTRGPRRRVAWIAAVVVVAVAAAVAVVRLGQAAHSSAGSAPSGSASPTSAGGQSQSAPPRSAQFPASSLAPSHGALFGAWVAPTGGSNYTALERSISTFEHRIGRPLAIDQLYVPWGNEFPMQVVRWDLGRGSVPMISWAGTHTNQVAAGVYDRQFRARAVELRDLHRPVMLRWFAEMDGGQYRPIVASPASFIAAWRHVHDIFVRAGASNVIWVWCPNALHFVNGVAQQYYPGSSYVDWVGADGYNWAPTLKRAPWRDFASIFSTFYRWGLSVGKPMLIGEYGVLERKPGDKAAWYRQTDNEVRTRFPDIKALIYFNSDLDGYDWRITTSATALAEFRAFATDPYFRARPRG